MTITTNFYGRSDTRTRTIGGTNMDIEELEGQLNDTVDTYRSEVSTLMYDYASMDEEEKAFHLPNMLDHMNKHAYYTFVQFQENIIEYLRSVK